MLTTVFLAVYVVWTVLPIFIMFVSSLKDLLEAFKLPAVGDWSGIGVFFDFSPTFKHYHNLFADLNFTVYFGNSLARRRLGAGLGRAGVDVRLRAVADRVPRQERPVLLDHLDPHGAGGGGDGPALRHLPLGRAGRDRARPDPGLHHLQPPLRHLDPQGLLRQCALRDRGSGDVRRLHPLPGLSRILPLVAPGIGAFLVLCILFAWNDFLFASIIGSGGAKTLPVATKELVQPQNIQWGSIMAAGVVTTMPMMLLGLLIRRYLVTGLTMGAVRE